MFFIIYCCGDHFEPSCMNQVRGGTIQLWPQEQFKVFERAVFKQEISVKTNNDNMTSN